ncbi:MAG TPA: molecular chaperone DnaJ [Polyangiaceae bacterium]|jgi:RecJ-like exonuclease|nr:molecular chaperone DnaJ [Polyangiaceae bacterium]
MASETCRFCGGDGRISNSFGSETTCPSCHGSGRRAEASGLRDVTKTKPSHHRAPNSKATVAVNPNVPLTFEGIQLAGEVQASQVASETKSKLTREIVEYETSHGRCTQTFIKKVRKQIR